MNTNQISVIIITKNEEHNITSCLESVKWADEIIVVDSYSTDDTVELAKKFQNVKIFQRTFDGFGQQKNFALSKATGKWILNIDADERVTEELKNEILNNIKSDEYDAFFVRRKNIVFGDWWDDGKARALRIFKKDKGIFANVYVHEYVICKGKTKALNFPLLHYSKALANIKEYVNTYLNDYTTKLSLDLYNKNIRISAKNTIYYFLIKPVLIFLNKFFLKKYYSHGIRGLILALFVAVAYIISYAKLWELNTNQKNINNNDTK